MEVMTTVEIRNYVRILWHRAWLVAGLPVLVVALGLLRAAPASPPSYTATMRYSVGLMPEPRESTYTYDRYYTWLTAEYLADDLTEVVRSQEVAEAVVAEAQRRGLNAQVAPGAIQGATTGGKLHRILTVNMGWGNRDELAVLAESLSTVLTQGQAAYFAQFREAGTPVILHRIDPPSISEVGPGMRQRLDLPLRLMLALFAGVGGAFLLEYLDDSVHGAADLTARDLEVIGAIPRRSSLPWAGRGQP
jgi:capsular polysaccharide biosynthesis protein